jgi:8-oxo-dGTP diphosphatase
MNNTNFDETVEHPRVTVDILIFSVIDGQLKTLLIKRKGKIFRDFWAIPGGYVLKDESLEDAALRELAEETGVKDVYLEQLFTFGDPKRDPRGRVITVSYYALINGENLRLQASSDAAEVSWFPVKRVPTLAFDHNQILKLGVERLKAKIGYSNVVFGLLPKRFRLSELQKMYEIILGEKLDKRNFRKKIMSLGLLVATGQKEIEGAHRPAMLYQFKNRNVINFDFMIA